MITFLARDKTLSSTLYCMTSQARGGGLDQQIPLSGRRGHRRGLLKGGVYLVERPHGCDAPTTFEFARTRLP